jgi:hypothetical protein
MSKEVLQITFKKAKVPDSKLGKWFYWKIYWKVWQIWRPKMLAKFYGALSNFIFALMPKAEREKILKEFENIEVHIKDETNE